MEAFNFKDFENKFLEYIEQNQEFFEKCAEELTSKARSIRVRVEECKEKNEINVNEKEVRDFDCLSRDKYTISGKEDADFKIFNQSVENELVIDVQHAPFVYESSCKTPLCFSRLTHECILDSSIYLIGSYYVRVSIKKLSSKESRLLLLIGKHFNTSEHEFNLKSDQSNRILFKKTLHESILIGRSSSANTIFISGNEISRQHAEIRFNSRWEIKDTSRFGVWKALHSSLTLSGPSKHLSIANNLKLNFNGVVLGFTSALT